MPDYVETAVTVRPAIELVGYQRARVTIIRNAMGNKR
jgi:hypothetical protein